ncbi:GTP pyrophosphokinase family protein [Fictibacillus enclensis]|uniref:GTP diphosphokinase n=1 Tax=Fictibacillus enclensis TaxID=1017270 RepID=A0A0V8JCY5_9BACL|nr:MULTISPECIES: GTP pyrophosphokinase family protein [Fictibacillus]KSU84869.1 GTP pyrophosphokinase [Fictibacillus enclensis]MDM5337841.1 GTP pyrophosphokinase family protein [Fictibacillus enclensis]RXY99477.1 GTP pyrophosphokinase family protein [Fictibacillus sp. S7]WHY74202.1 GTP pyrophosphokinase family protein [Fictibacillus enclensis]SCB87095.1 putative GTP pyrophosphokinase [Fictibacillus enclensis]
MDWETLLAPYKQAVDELKVKFRGIREQYQKTIKQSPIEFVTGRVKPINSILNKAWQKNIPLDKIEEEIQDLAGLRIMCQFTDDIKKVIDMLRNRKDFEIVEERDYITNKKPSGYRSYHLVIRYPVQTLDGEKPLLVEVQIRTLAMNFWATIEHSLNYKYQGQIPKDIQLRLQRAAEAAGRLDEEMAEIRGEVQEAQIVFSERTDDGPGSAPTT